VKLEDREDDIWGDLLASFAKALENINALRKQEKLEPVQQFAALGVAEKGPPVLAAWTKVTSGVAFKVCTKLTVNDEQEYVTLDIESGTGILTSVTPMTVLGKDAVLDLMGKMGEGESVEEIPEEGNKYRCNEDVEKAAKLDGAVGEQEAGIAHVMVGGLRGWGSHAASLGMKEKKADVVQLHGCAARRGKRGPLRALGLLQARNKISYQHAAEARRGKSTRETPAAYNFREQFPECAMEVKDQGQCGSCYAFAAAAAGGERLCQRNAKAGMGAPKVPLSQQDLVSCGSSGAANYQTPFCTNGHIRTYSNGCDGGFTMPVLFYMHEHGMADLDCAPYVSGGGSFHDHFDVTGERVPICAEVKSDQCRAEAPKNKLGVPVFCPSGDIPCIEAAILDGPVVASMSTTEQFMRDYPADFPDEVFRRTDGTGCGGAVYLGEHMVQLYGWGTTADGVDYWLARNSWGKGWGLEGLFKIKKGTNELGIEANVAFNAVEVDDRSAYESDCVKITELAEGCKVTNVCEDIRSAELRVEGKSVGESCTSGGIYTLQLKPGDDHAQTLPDSTLCAVVADESAGPFDPTRHYSDVTQQFKDAGYDWIECAMTNSFPGDAGDLCICCGYSCACIPANAGAAALDRFFCDADACATQSGGKIEEKLFPY